MRDSEHPHDDAARRGNTQTYDTCIEGGTFPNNHQATTDKSIIVTALHEWSGGAIFEDQGIRLSWGGFAPTFATAYEQNFVLDILKEDNSLIIPIISEIPSQHENSPTRKKPAAKTNLRLHIDAKETYAIDKKTPLKNPELAHRLWASCATEDCMAYLEYQIGASPIPFIEDIFSDMRPIIYGHLKTDLSPAQVWRAIWTAVKEGSTHIKNTFITSEDASRKIREKLKYLLHRAVDNELFRGYSRLTPQTAIIQKIQKTFGISDSTQGWEVLAIMMENSIDAGMDSADESPPPCY